MKSYKWKKKCIVCHSYILNRKKGAKYCIKCAELKKTYKYKKKHIGRDNNEI